MKSIILSENNIRTLFNAMIKESYALWPAKVELVKDYLDSHFARAKATIMDDNGRPSFQEVVAWLDDNKQVVKTLTDVQLFYVIQDEFKDIIPDKNERDKFLMSVLKNWYSNKISKNNTLSVT